ncbi:hypothetical protein [Lysobacter sp. GCM10012299]|uniref:hypothetical protein n=1 Tax=Lysobacter sp. GCM10012299 TaxID=3317333 RepID=UPI003621AF5E
MATKTLNINAQEAVFLALMYDMDTEARELVRTLMRELVTVTQTAAAAAAGGAQ